MTPASRRGGALGLLLLGLLLAGDSVRAAEASYGDRPVGDSVEGLDGALGRAVEERKRLETLFPGLKARLRRYPNFVADSEVVLDARTFVFPLRELSAEEAHAWTIGGKLRFRTGWWRDMLQVGAGLYTSAPILSDDPDALTGLLRPDDEGFFVFGEAFARFKWRDNQATIGRMELDLPYVNINDSRMTPNTFQGVFAKGVGRGVPLLNRLDWVAGYLTDIRPRNDDEFVSMAERAGSVFSDKAPAFDAATDLEPLETGNEGMALLGIQFRPAENVALGVYEYLVPNTLSITYLATNYTLKLSSDWGMRFQVQGTWQRSLGDEQIGRFHAWAAGLRVAASYRSLTGWLAATQIGDNAGILSPYGSYPGFVSLMQADFDRAEERAYVVGLSMAPKIAPRWSGFFQYARGDGGRDVLGPGGADEQEVNLTVDYRIDDGRFRGLWLRVRGSVLERDGAPSRAYQARIILNYTLPIL